MDSYTDFRHPQPVEQSGLMACCSPATLLTLPSGFEQGQQHHQPDTCSFPPAVCALPQQQQQQGQYDLQDPQGGQLLSPPTCCSDTSLYMSPYMSYQSTIQNIWPSPPLGPGDIQNCISFQDSPVCGSACLPIYNSSNDNSPTSPSGWSTVSGYPPTTTFFPQQHPGDQSFAQVCTPMSAQDLPHHYSDMPTPYTESYHAESDTEMPTGMNMSVSSSDVMPSLSAVPPSSSVGSPEGLRAETPASLVMPKIEPMENQDAEFMDSILAVPNAADPIAASGVGHDEKNDEPYAKLIYRALMSRPDYTMTLQELYQWFRDNTNKAKNEKGGWQNSIRHNLSMNAVSLTPKTSTSLLYMQLFWFLFFFHPEGSGIPCYGAQHAAHLFLCVYLLFFFSSRPLLLRQQYHLPGSQFDTYNSGGWDNRYADCFFLP